jgi:hypothetical protein
MLALAAAGIAPAQDLSVRTTVDQTVVGLNDQFTLSIEISGKGANSASDPQVPDLSAFASFLGSGSSQNISFINGRMSSSKVISCTFAATAVGKHRIPPVQVTAGGKTVSSAGIDIEIVQAQSGGTAGSSQAPAQQAAPVQGAGPAEGDLFLRATVDKRQVFPNEPVTVTFKLYTRVNLSGLGLSKLPSTAGFWAEDFDMPQRPQPVEEILDGKKYTTLVVKKTALFPVASGAKTIDPMTLDCDVHVRTRSRDPLADFFDDSFFYGKTVRKQVRSKPVAIDVLPFPEEGKPSDFSGLSGRFRISASADKASVKTNEAVTYRIAIEGDGNIRQIAAPKPAFPSDFEVYPPKTAETVTRSGGRITGKKTFEYVLIPRAPGDETLDPVRFSYFDPASRAYKTLQSETLRLKVEQGAGTYASPVSGGLSKEEVRLVGQDIRFIRTASPSFRRIGESGFPAAAFWAILLAPLGCLVAALFRRRHIDRLEGDVAYARGIRASGAVRRRLSAARALIRPEARKEFYAEAGRAIQGYLGDRLNIAEAGMLSEEVRTILASKGVSEQSIQGVFDCLSVCDMKRFSPDTATPDEMKHFFKTVETAIMRLEKEL